MRGNSNPMTSRIAPAVLGDDRLGKMHEGKHDEPSEFSLGMGSQLIERQIVLYITNLKHVLPSW